MTPDDLFPIRLSADAVDEGFTENVWWIDIGRKEQQIELLVPIALIAAGGFFLGAVVGRRFIVVVAALPWPVGLIGTWMGLWGNGLDHDTARWLIVTVVGLYALAGTVGAAVGVLARKRYGKRHRLSLRDA